MTVLISKPSINLREALKKSPSGIAGEAVLRSDTEAEAREALSLDNHETLTISTDGVIADFESTGIDDNATSTKLTVSNTGIDVTGTVTADGLTVDGDAEINAIRPILDMMCTGASNENLRIDVNLGTFRFRQLTDAKDSATERFHLDTSTGDISFFEDTGTTPKFFWDASAEALGIGTTSIRSTGALSTSQLSVESGGYAAAQFFSNANSADGSYLGLWKARGGVVGGTTDVQNGDTLGGILAGGWGDGAFRNSSDIKLEVDGSTISASSMPGRIVFSTTPSGSVSAVERMRIDSSGNVGIGTVPEAWYTPLSTRALQVGGTTSLWALSNGSTDLRTSLDNNLYVSSASGQNTYLNTGAASRYQQVNGTHIWYTAASGTADTTATVSERMRIDASGNVGIGTSSPGTILAIGPDSNTSQTISISGPRASLKYDTTIGIAGAVVLRGGSKQVNIDTGGPSNPIVFITQNGTESARIDSSGNLLVGKTVANDTDVGFSVRSNNYISSVRDGGAAGLFNRLTSDGNIVLFQKDGSSVGQIGAYAGSLFVGGVNSGVFFNGNGMEPTSGGSTRVDNTENIGAAAWRFKDIYATNATIQTSDANEKQDIAELDEAERRVAVAAKGLLRKFRWISSVEKKGDDARIHFGIIAQDLQAAFEAEGLDAGRYAMFIHSTWTDEETGEERSRMGVRYSELLAFIIAAL